MKRREHDIWIKESSIAETADSSWGIYVQKSISNGKTPTQMHAADRNGSSTESPSKDNDNR
jgi:hypothetical protein